MQQFKDSKEVDFNKDWKLVTLFIGGNDLCRYDQNKEVHGPTAYIQDIISGIDILFKELPRTFVNLVSVLDAGQVRLLNKGKRRAISLRSNFELKSHSVLFITKGLVCNVLHKFVCKEAAFPSSPDYTKELEAVYQQYINFTNNLSGRWEGREDFTVVIQPMFEEFKLPFLPDGEPDLSFFAPDCFHLSNKGHGKHF